MNINMNMFSAKIIPQMLSAEKTELREEICSDLLQRTRNKPNLLQLGNYMWCNFNIYVWHGNKSTINALDVIKLSKCKKKKKKDLMRLSKFKAMLTVFFDTQDVWWQSGFQVARLSIINITSKSWLNLHERLRRKLPGLWDIGWIFLQDNAPSHIVLCVQQFLASKNIAVLAHLTYSPDHTPCDFLLFLNFKFSFKEKYFVLVETVKSQTKVFLYSLAENNLKNCFE
jgi:hypothetical protein